MTINAGTATDYLDLLDQLVEVVTSRHLATIAINAGGTGYAVNDVLGITNTGSTNTHVAQIEVLAVSSGVITSARIYRGGAYTVDPTTTTGNAATGGTGTGATFNLTFAATGWSVLARQSVAASATVAAGGSGYTNGSTDVLTLVGGVLAEGGSAATFTATVSGGAVTSVALLSAGDYEVVPSNAVLTTVSPSGGTGCTLNVTFNTKSGENMVVLQGDAGAEIDPLVGIKPYSSFTDQTGLNTVYNWALFGFTAWSDTAAMHQQANVSPGFASIADGTLTTTSGGDGAFVPLKDSDAFNINWIISATGRRVVVNAEVSSSTTQYDANFSFGLLNQLGVSTEVPFPAYVQGCSDRPRVWYADVSSAWGGIVEVLQRTLGPTFAWAPEGQWINCRVGSFSSNTDLSPSFGVSGSGGNGYVWPLGAAPQQSGDDVIWAEPGNDGFDNEDLTLASNAIEIYRTPNTGGDLFALYRVHLGQSDSSSGFYRVFGEIEGVFWFHQADSGASTKDRIPEGTNRYTVLQNGTQTNPYSFFALRED